MRSPHQLVAITVFMVISSIHALSMQVDNEADSAESGFSISLNTIGPSGAMILAAADSNVASVLQAGFGATYSFSKAWHLGLTLKVGVVEYAPDLFSTSRTMTPFLNGMLTGVYALPVSPEWISVEGILTIAYGRSTDQFLPNFQTVLGAEVDIPISRNKDGTPLIYAFVVPGYGVDWEQNANRGFCSFGLGVMNWFQLSFDVVTLFDPTSSIIHPGRLK